MKIQKVIDMEESSRKANMQSEDMQNADMQSDDSVKRVVDTALEAGRILLKNGAEIFRVEETITRICHHFGVTKVDIFTLSHGLFVSAENEKGEAYTKVKHIPLSGANLEIVAEVNALSRQISEGHVTLQEAEERLKEIRKTPPKRWQFQILATGMSAACYGFLLGATLTESLVTFCIGCVLGVWVLFAKRLHLSKIIINSVGGMIITLLAIFARAICSSVVLQLDGMIIGALMPLVPGLAFTNAIRDIADSDILSGTVRMIDALMVFVYIAVGVGIVLIVYNNMTGGFIL